MDTSGQASGNSSIECNSVHDLQKEAAAKPWLALFVIGNGFVEFQFGGKREPRLHLAKTLAKNVRKGTRARLTGPIGLAAPAKLLPELRFVLLTRFFQAQEQLFLQCLALGSTKGQGLFSDYFRTFVHGSILRGSAAHNASS